MAVARIAAALVRIQWQLPKNAMEFFHPRQDGCR
jgi:hypothetical protein